MTRQLSMLAAALMAVVLAVPEARAIDPARGSTVPNDRNSTIPGLDRTTPEADPFDRSFPFTDRISRTDTNLTPTSRVIPAQVDTQLIQTPSLVTTHQKWRLGVYAKDLDTGVRVATVVPRSPAARAGLEENDLIIAVSGHQVGYVDGELHDLGDEFNIHASEDGFVSMLVQNHRNQQVVVLPVQLESLVSTVKGSLSFRDRLAVSPDAVATIELREIVRPGAPLITLHREVLRGPIRSPMQFEVEYEPAQINPRRQYVMHASVADRNQTLYTTTDAYPVLTNGNSDQVNILMQRVGSGSPGYHDPADDLAQVTQWYRKYLGRKAERHELEVWRTHLERGRKLTEIEAYLLGGNEFWNQSYRHQDEFIKRLHQVVLGEPPFPEESRYWLARMEQLDGRRSQVVAEFLAATGRTR